MKFYKRIGLLVSSYHDKDSHPRWVNDWDAKTQAMYWQGYGFGLTGINTEEERVKAVKRACVSLDGRLFVRWFGYYSPHVDAFWAGESDAIVAIGLAAHPLGPAACAKE